MSLPTRRASPQASAVRAFGLVALGAAAASCRSTTVTQLIVVIDTDYAVPREIDTLQLSAAGTGNTVTSMGARDSLHLPATVSLSPASSSLDVTITATGLLGQTTVATAVVQTQFVQGETHVVRLTLTHRCANIDCPMGHTCRAGCCTSVALPASALPLFDGTIPDGSTDLACPIRAGLYDTFGPDTWTTAGRPGTYDPTHYDTSDPAVIASHVTALEYAGAHAAIVWWNGAGSTSDTNFALLLSGSRGHALRWAVYDRAESGGSNPDVPTIQARLAYVRQTYGSDPNYLTVDGRPVVFVYLGTGDDCPTIARWIQANAAVGVYLDVKVPSDWQSCMQPDAWHQYAPTEPTDQQHGFSFTVSPGYCMSPSTTCIARDAGAFATGVQAMVASGASFQFVTSFNDWAAGSATENGPAWPSDTAHPGGMGVYLDILHDADAGH